MYKLSLAITILLLTEVGYGQATRSQVYGGTLTRQAQTFYLQSDVGLQTYESKAAASNATTTANTYKVGGFAGESRRLGVSLTSAESITSFDLNGTRIRSDWKDLDMQLRLGFINPFVTISQSEMNVRSDESELLNVFGQGIGGGGTVQVPLTEEIITTASGKVILGTKAHDTLGSKVKMGTRTEIDLNASIDITQHVLDYFVGYRSRSYSIKVDGAEAEETQSMPYTGVRLGLYF